MLALPLTAHYEGLKTKAYLDPVGIVTICYGETENVFIHDIKTEDECKEMLSARLGWFALQVDKLVTVDATPEQLAAYTSFTYNVGVNTFKKSSVLRLANEGKRKESCNFLTRYVYAGGKILPGLVKRREAEKRLCLDGI